MTTAMMTTTTEGGRFDFDDGGSYVGEWCEGRAHGLGIATGPDNQGEYSGEWSLGFESRGVYIWPSGNLYEGNWSKGKRHGEGVQVKGRWIYKGAFTTGFCGRYGVKESLTSVAKYEGSWHLNQFDGFGVETNSDGSTYSGAWSKGLRQGLGVRKSAPYGQASDTAKAVRAAHSENSIISANDSDRAFREAEQRRQDEIRSGFVLRMAPINHGEAGRKGLFDKKPSFRKALMRKLRKQKSTGDLSSRSGRAGGSLRSTVSGTSQMTNHSLPIHAESPLSSIEEPIIAPNVVETYSGQWNDDKRSGYGVAERTDGLRYEGEWFSNKRDGYGVTYLPGGTKEEGRYKENVLVQALNKRSKLFILRHSRLRDSVEEAIRKAKEAARDAVEKAAETAYQRAQTARMAAASAEARAREARHLSDQARMIAREFAQDFPQPGPSWERQCNVGSSPPSNIHTLQRGGGQFGQTLSPQSKTTADTLVAPDSLEVSGGSRRGSFRSSFRRANANNQQRSGEDQTFAMHQNSSQQHQPMTQSPYKGAQFHMATLTTNQAPPAMSASITNDGMKNTKMGMNATTLSRTSGPNFQEAKLFPNSAPPQVNLTPPQNQNQMVITNKHSAQLSQSPPKMVATVVPTNQARLHTAEMTIVPQKSGIAQNQQRYVGSLAAMTTSTQLNDHFDQYTAPMAYNYNDPYGSPQMTMQYPTEPVDQHQESIAGNDWQKEPSDADTDTVSGRRKMEPSRRRTLPSIMTQKPVAPVPVGVTQPFDDTIHSQENLTGANTSSYIIENGIRKRVQAEGGRYRPPPESPKFGRPAAVRHRSIIQPDPDPDQMPELPNNYKFESQVELRRDLGEGSLPDVSVCTRMKQRSLMTREEVTRLSQARRQELLREAERRQKGEIIIRLADIREWFRGNFVVVCVLVVNILLAAALISLLSKSSLPPSS